MISTIVDRIADILSDDTFVNNCALASSLSGFQVPQIAKTYKHSVDNVSQFPSAFVIYDGADDIQYSTAGLKSVIQHRIYVGIVVQYSAPADIESAILTYIDALRPTLNSQVRDNATITDGRVSSIARDPIVPMQNGRYISSFSVTVQVLEYVDQNAVS